ncbi:MAG: inorganic phosphate transporter, partial [Candidatus Spechtbacterales bacterium]
MEIALIITLLLVLGAEFMNGFTDAPNAITTVVSTRTLPLRFAIILAVVFNIAGVFAGTAVAKIIGKGIIESSVIDLITIGSAMFVIIVWSFVAWWRGLPTSETHALVAALAGAGVATAGPGVLLLDGWRNVGIGLFFSTFLGLLAAYILTKIVRKIAAPFPPRHTKPTFRWLQILSSSFMAFSHGSNDGQKFIGVFALALFLGGATATFTIPLWVVVVCAIAMGVGTSFGGWRIIRTMGLKMVKIETYQGFCAETSAGIVISLASLI